MKNLINRIRSYFTEMISEMRKVTWTKRRELIASTGVVLVLSILVAIFIGILDVIFSRLLSLVIR